MAVCYEVSEVGYMWYGWWQDKEIVCFKLYQSTCDANCYV